MTGKNYKPVLTLEEWWQTHPGDFLRIGQTEKIRLSGGRVVLVDGEFFGFLSQFRWGSYPRKRETGWYVITMNRQEQFGKTKMIQMHRLIVRVPDGMEVDHINRNTLDNRRSNLRICTRTQNQRNRGANRNNKSGYKGVTTKPNDRFQARIQVGIKSVNLGTFASAENAARAYDKAALRIHREFARTNF